MNRARVSLVKCRGYEPKEVESAVRKAIGLLGGIEKFIRSNSRVLLKPNLLSARSPEEGVNTHPEVLRAVARCVKEVTPHIVVGDSPGGWELRDIEQVYEKSGIKRVCSEEGIKLVKFDKAINIGGLPIAAITKEVDAIISIPKLKSHSTTVITGAVKNTFGMVVGLHKASCHLNAPMPDEFAKVLIKVFNIVKPTFSIMDGIVGMDGEGPAAGSLRDIGLVIASQDAIALDVIFAKLVGVEPSKVHTIQEAKRNNAGVADLEDIDVLGERLGAVRIKNFKLPKASMVYMLPRPFIKFALSHFKFYPHIDKKRCQGCGLCFKICPKGAITKTPNGYFEVGVKECISCFCCYEVCPYKAVFLKKSFLARAIMR